MLINKDHLLHQLDGRPEDGWISIKAVRAMIEAEPTIDAVPVIRCKDCKYSYTNGFEGGFLEKHHKFMLPCTSVNENGFCYLAERKKE